MLRELFTPSEPFYFYPNPGNLGDIFIAEATRQFFRREGLSFKEYDPDNPPTGDNKYTLVLGGGGLSNHWGYADIFAQHLTNSRVKKGIILAHSFCDVDTFIKSLDERHTIVCREDASYSKCLALNPRSNIIRGDDMALLWKPGPPPTFNTDSRQNTEREEKEQKALLSQGWEKRVLTGVRNSTICFKNKKVAFILRTDKEKAVGYTSPYSYDISIAYSSSGRETKYTSLIVSTFAKALEYPDLVVTDRLHVSVMAYLLGKEVYLLDNDYGKLSGVYHQSLIGSPNVHLLEHGKLTPYLQQAWEAHNSPSPSKQAIVQEPEYQFLSTISHLKNKYRKTLFISKITFGKKRLHYLNKIDKLKKAIERCVENYKALQS
ncbi:MAG: polysaccharide pyruvyl transferase family protein [Akkermansia sp.]|nr:polysaccharide pyruvyl transferase family protein [Akkermansia sp.]